MEQYIKHFKIDRILAASILSAGIALLGYFIGDSLIKFKLQDRYVTVKGLAEREIKADRAIWPITIKATGDNLTEVNNKIESDRNIVVDFLVKQGFQEEEIEIGNYLVTDLLAQTYRNNASESFRYILSATITLKTPNIDLLKQTTRLQNVLVQKGVVIGTSGYANNEYTGPIYEFTKFNDIKPELLEEAIKNARKSAIKFAEDSGSTLGLLKKASQGTVLVSSAEGGENSEDYNSQAAKRSINKKIRVVTTLEYYLKD